jgi:hypothetical protein
MRTCDGLEIDLFEIPSPLRREKGHEFTNLSPLGSRKLGALCKSLDVARDYPSISVDSERE